MKQAVLTQFLALFFISTIAQTTEERPFSIWLSGGVDAGYSGEWRALPGIKGGLEGTVGDHFYYDVFVRANSNFDFFQVKENTILDLRSGSVLGGYRLAASDRLDLVVLTGLGYSNGTFLGKGFPVERPSIFGSTSIDTEYEITGFHEITIPLHLRAVYSGRIIGGSLGAYYNFQQHYNYGFLLSALLRLH